MEVVMGDYSPASVSYLKSIRKYADSLGIQVVETDKLRSPGIIISGHSDDIPLEFDLDCQGIAARTEFYLKDNQKYAPCTPKAILKILEYYGMTDVCIIGRGENVGRPLAHLLQLNNYTVTLCHSKTIDLKKHMKAAEIIVNASGTLLKIDWRKLQVTIGPIEYRGRLIGFPKIGKYTTECLFETLKERLNGN